MDESGIIDKNSDSEMLSQDFHRGFVQMECDQRKNGCTYGLPHYHCKICEKQVNDDQKRMDYHPCCSEECINIYNQQKYPAVLTKEP